MRIWPDRSLRAKRSNPGNARSALAAPGLLRRPCGAPRNDVALRRGVAARPSCKFRGDALRRGAILLGEGVHRLLRGSGEVAAVLFFYLFDLLGDLAQASDRFGVVPFVMGEREHRLGDDAELLAVARDVRGHFLLDCRIALVVHRDVLERPVGKDRLVETRRGKIPREDQKRIAHVTLLSPGNGCRKIPPAAIFLSQVAPSGRCAVARARAISRAMSRSASAARLPLNEPPQRPTLARERAAMRRGIVPVAGCGEAGRGPLAGPVVAAAVILDPKRVPRGLDDSKKLSAPMREKLYAVICASAHVAVAFAPPARIDRDNILRASLWALARAV